MKKLLIPIILLLIILSAQSCKSTREASSETEPTQTAVTSPQPSQEDLDYYSRQPKRGDLDPADVATIVNYAKEKASLVCKIQIAERQAEQNPAMAEENKRKIISLEQSIKALDTKNESFMDNDDKWRYYNKVYEKETEKCQ